MRGREPYTYYQVCVTTKNKIYRDLIEELSARKGMTMSTYILDLVRKDAEAWQESGREFLTPIPEKF